MDWSHNHQYESLAEGIIVQACHDFTEATKRLKRDPGNYKAILEKRECERFFRSRYFGKLTSLDPELLMLKLAEVQI